MQKGGNRHLLIPPKAAVKATRSQSAFKAKAEPNVIVPLEEFCFQCSRRRAARAAPCFTPHLLGNTEPWSSHVDPGPAPCPVLRHSEQSPFLSCPSQLLFSKNCWFGHLLPHAHLAGAQFATGLQQRDFPQGCQPSAPPRLARLRSSQHQVLSLQFYSSSGERSKQEQPFQKQQ